MRRSATLAAISVVALTASGALPVAANPLKSRLTAIDLADCKVLARHKDGNSYRCPGLPGWPVYVASGDDRQFVSFGANPEKRKAATETLGAFNTIFERGKRPAIEWRIERKGGREVPFATIVQFHTARDGAKGEVLVVSKVDARQACHLAHIDANANPDGMALARRWADENARSRGCDKPAETIGKSGASPM